MQNNDEKIGSVLDGKYRFKRIIGKGGMGTVYLATHLELRRTFAIKMFHPHLIGEKELTYRFLHEAKGTARLRHRHIVSIIDLGMDEKDIPFFVMDYLKGESLKQRLKRVEKLSLKESADIIVQTLTGLHAAHTEGIIHRDMKPGNIFLAIEPDGSEFVKIIDFGVARFRELEIEAKIELTDEGELLGTPSYMSPEQTIGKHRHIDHRTDIYACGITLYRCLTGINPFMDKSRFEIIRNIHEMDVPPPSEILDTIPPEVDEVIMKAIEREKDNRFKDCRAFIKAVKVLYDVDGSRPVNHIARIVAGDIEIEESVPPGDLDMDGANLKPVRRRPGLNLFKTALAAIPVLILSLIHI